jgi:DivIVA domain-containing protein
LSVTPTIVKPPATSVRTSGETASEAAIRRPYRGPQAGAKWILSPVQVTSDQDKRPGTLPDGQRHSWPVARPSSYAPPVNGDEVRHTWFWDGEYAVWEVHDLLRRVAAELDAGRPAGPLIENATFRRVSQGYDIDAVDWFLDQLLLRPGHAELTGTSADPWRDLAVAQLIRSQPGDAEPPVRRPPNLRKYLSGECENAWRDFGQEPGTHLQWGRARRGRLWVPRYELRTAEQQTIASREGGTRRMTVHAGGRSFTYKKPDIPARSTADSWPPDIAGAATRSWRDYTGHFAAETMSSKAQRKEARTAHELADEAGIPILYTSGQNFGRRAYACISFPDQRWLRFLVRGTKSWNAIMTAVDQAGNSLARYRASTVDSPWPQAQVEITVHPDRELTDELLLAIAISAEWLESYFSSPNHSGAGAVAAGG